MPPKVNPDSWKTRYVVKPGPLPSECWIWTGYKNDHGYGIISQGRGNRYRAHRYVYERLVGPIPEGKELDHKCRNRACINPRHMDVVTHMLNTQRGDIGLHNARKDECKQGHEFTPENTILRPGRNGEMWRQCRTCHRKTMRELKRKRHAEWRKDLSLCGQCGKPRDDERFKLCTKCRMRIAKRAQSRS